MGLTFANKVTISRIVLVPFIVAVLLYYKPDRDYLRFVALSLFVLAVTSDAVDGFIARNHRQKTKAGAVLDPLADKILIISVVICLYKLRFYFEQVQFPLWLVVGLVSREAILALGSVIVQMTTGKLVIEANFLGKIAAFLQVVCVLGMFLQIKPSSYLWEAVLAISVISGLIYIREGIKIINDSAR